MAQIRFLIVEKVGIETALTNLLLYQSFLKQAKLSDEWKHTILKIIGVIRATILQLATINWFTIICVALQDVAL